MGSGEGEQLGRGLLTGRVGKAADGVVGGAAGSAGLGSWEQPSALGAGSKSSQAGGPSPAAQGRGSCTLPAPEGSAAARTTCQPVPRKTRWLPGPGRGGRLGVAAARWPQQAHQRSFRLRVLACTSPASIGPSLVGEVVEGGGDSFGVTGPGGAPWGQLGKRCRPPTPRPRAGGLRGRRPGVRPRRCPPHQGIDPVLLHMGRLVDKAPLVLDPRAEVQGAEEEPEELREEGAAGARPTR